MPQNNSGAEPTSDTDLTLDLTQDQPAPGGAAPAGGAAAVPPPGGPVVAPPAGGDSAGAPPPGGPPLTLTVTDPQTQPQPRIQLKPYVQVKQWDYVRMVVTVGLLLMLGWVIVWASIESASWPTHWSQTKEMLQTILPAVTGLIGSVIGFYFGSGVNSSNTVTLEPLVVESSSRSCLLGYPAKCKHVCRGRRRLRGGARSRYSRPAVALDFGIRLQAGEGFLTINGFHQAAFQFIIAAVEHFPRLHQFVEISGQHILQKLVGPTSALRREVVELLLNIRGEVYFHDQKVRRNPAYGKLHNQTLAPSFASTTFLWKKAEAVVVGFLPGGVLTPLQSCTASESCRSSFPFVRS